MRFMNLSPAKLFDQSSLGISLSQTSLRGVSLDKDGQIKKSGQVQIDPHIFNQNQIQTEPLGQALQQLLKQMELEQGYAAVTLPEYYSFTRSYTLPKMDLADVGEALKWQIEKILPLPSQSIYFDWKLIEETEENISVLVIAMQRSILDTMIEVFESTKIKPVSFEPSTSALSRILQDKIQGSNILIELNPQGSAATLIDEGASRLTITNQFSSNSPEETQIALQKTSISVQSLINHLGTLKQTGQVETINIYLTGESTSGEVAQWMGSLLNRQIQILELPQAQVPFHQAYAAATAHLIPGRNGASVNLLPDTLRDYYQASKEYTKMMNYLQIIGVISGVSLTISALALAWSFGRAQMTGNDLENLANQNTEYSLDANEVATINNSSQAIVNLFPRKTTPVDQLVTIYGSQSSGIEITSVSYERLEPPVVNITGQASDRSTLLEFRDELNQSPLFTQVNLPIDALEQPTNINFNLNLQLAGTN